MSKTSKTAETQTWETAPVCPTLRRDEVHVWRARLAQPEVETFQELLSTDERRRADAFRFSRDRDNFIVARAVLRIILGQYLRLPPAHLRFSYNPFGKPELDTATGGRPLFFNLSHAGNIALYAIASGREVGIDVERVREGVACAEIVEHFFSRREVAAWRVLSPEVQTQAFFNCWTRKEAYIKARGAGLSLPLDKFDVSLSPHEPAALLTTHLDTQEAARWSLRELTPGPRYVAAIAVEGRGWHLRCWQWAGEGTSDHLSVAAQKS